MKTVLVNYATNTFPFRDHQRINALTGKLFGFDECRSLGPGIIDPVFVEVNRETLSARLGAGYWLWKPYILTRVLEEIEDGDFLCYCDAGMHFVNPIQPMLDRMDQHRLDLLILGEGFRESQYTKRDAFLMMSADTPANVNTPQRFASSFMLRKSYWSMQFCRDWLTYAEQPQILTDKPNRCGQSNYKDFIAHRYDQSIFSLLTKLHGVECLRLDYVADGLPTHGKQIINHVRQTLSAREIITRLIAQNVLNIVDLELLH